MNNLLELLDRRVAEDPEFESLIFLEDGESISDILTYRKLKEQAQRLAGFFQSTRMQGERVMLSLPHNLTYFIGLYGCLYAGIVAIPAFPPRNNRNMNRIAKILEDSGTCYVLTDRSGFDYIKSKIHGYEHIQYIIIEEALSENKPYYPYHPHQEDLAYLQYTSGSTGNPKGIMISHGNVLANATACRKTMFPDAERVITWLPLYHDMGLISWFTYLLKGDVSCYFMTSSTFIQSPVKWLRAITKYRGQFLVAPNFAFDLCCAKVDDKSMGELDLSSISSMVCGSEKIKFSTVKNFMTKFGKAGLTKETFCPSYGLAEATLIVSFNNPGEKAVIATKNNYDRLLDWDAAELNATNIFDLTVGIGTLAEGAEVIIVDEKGAEVTDGKVGEIYVHFPGSVASGYWNNPPLSEKIFMNKIKNQGEKNYLKTGDLGFKIKDELFYAGRVKELIVIRGTKYYPEDIELAVAVSTRLLEENSIAAISVNDKEDENLIIIAELKRESSREKNYDSLIYTIRQKIAEEFDIQPHTILLIKPYSLSKTSSGKIQRVIMKDLYLQGQLEIIHAWQTENSEQEGNDLLSPDSINREYLEKWLCDKIAAYGEFPAEDIDMDIPLKHYPLDSINAVSISEDINNRLDIQTKPDMFWAFDSLHELVDYLYELYIQKALN